MLLPQFSLKTVLLLVSACACFFLVAGQAYQGEAWAIGVTVAVSSLPVCFLVYAIFYGITAVVARVTGVQRLPAKTSQGGFQLGPDEHIEPAQPVDAAQDGGEAVALDAER